MWSNGPQSRPDRVVRYPSRDVPVTAQACEFCDRPSASAGNAQFAVQIQAKIQPQLGKPVPGCTHQSGIAPRNPGCHAGPELFWQRGQTDSKRSEFSCIMIGQEME